MCGAVPEGGWSTLCSTNKDTWDCESIMLCGCIYSRKIKIHRRDMLAIRGTVNPCARASCSAGVFTAVILRFVVRLLNVLILRRKIKSDIATDRLIIAALRTPGQPSVQSFLTGLSKLVVTLMSHTACA